MENPNYFIILYIYIYIYIFLFFLCFHFRQFGQIKRCYSELQYKYRFELSWNQQSCNSLCCVYRASTPRRESILRKWRRKSWILLVISGLYYSQDSTKPLSFQVLLGQFMSDQYCTRFWAECLQMGVSAWFIVFLKVQVSPRMRWSWL